MKKVLLIIAIIVIVIIGAAIALPIIFKDQIIQKVKDEANKNLTAKLDFGDFDVTILRSFPDFTLDLNNFSLSGTGDFAGDTLASIRDFHVTLDLMSVIKGQQYEIKTIRLDEPRIKARVLEDGRANWDITIPDSAKKEEPEEATAFKASLKEFEINNGYVVYDDAQGGMKAVLVDLDHKLSGDFTQDNFTMKTQTDIAELSFIQTGIAYLNKVKTSMKADFDMDMKNARYIFKENELQLNELFLGFDGWVALVGENTDMDVKFFAKKTDFKNILSLVPAVYSKDFENVKTAGKIALDGHVKGRMNETSQPGFGTKINIEDAMFQYPDLPAAVKNIQAKINVNNPDGVPDHTAIDIDRFYMEMAGNPVDITMKVRTPVSDPYINGKVEGKVNLGTVKDVVPLDEGESMNGTIIADINMKGNLSAIEKEQYENFDMSGQLIVLDLDYKSKDTPYDMKINKAHLNFSPRFVELAAFESQMGKSDINATGKIQNFLQYIFKDELLTGTFNMNSNLLDLNQFMTEEEETTAAAEEPMTVLEVPANLNFIMGTSIGKLLYENLELNNVSGTMRIADRMIDIQGLRANMLGGTMVMKGIYETKNVKKPGIDFDIEVQNFDIQQTVKYMETVQTMSPIAKHAYGSYSTKFTLKGALDEKMEPVYPSLSGLGILAAEGITIKDFKPISKVADALNMPQLKSFTTGKINPSFEFKDGKVFVKPFDMMIGNIFSNISGTNGFDQTINYVWDMEIPKKAMGTEVTGALRDVIGKANKLGTDFGKLEKVKLQALITGTVIDPKIKLNLKDLAANVADEVKDEIKDQAMQKKEELEAKAREKADSIRQAAEGRAREEADRVKREAEQKAKARADSVKKAAENKAKEEAKKKLKGIFK